jgi:hypothetical protein
MSSIDSSLRSIVNEDGAVILDITANRMLILNTTGGYIWERLQQGKSISEIAYELGKESGREPCELERDVHDFVGQLVSKSLLCGEGASRQERLEGRR